MPLPALISQSLQVGSESDQVSNSLVDLHDVATRNVIGVSARSIRLSTDRQQFADRIEIKSKIPRMANEVQAREIVKTIATLFALGTTLKSSKAV